MLEGQYVLSRMNFSTEVELVDISLGGASINTDRKLNIGESYNCHIKDGEQTVSVAGTVIWQEPDKPKTHDNPEAANSYCVGLCFDKVFTNKGDNLAGLIEDWARSEHQRHRVRGVRVKLKKASAELDHFGQYRVDEISFGGMRLEAALKIEKGSELDIKMSIPGTMKPVKVRAKVASCRKLGDASPARYKIGVEFMDIGLNDLSHLKKLIYSLD